MPYPADLVGKYINYRVDPGRNNANGLALVNGVLPGQTTAAAVSVYTGGAPNGLGVIPMAPHLPNWNFTFLKYVAGAVTTAGLGGPVLTGPMSGCYLCKYTQAGVQGLAHVGTANAPDSVESVAAKNAWVTFTGRGDVSAVSGGTPFDYFTTNEYAAAMVVPGHVPLVAGYFDGGSSYSMLLAPVPPTKNSLGVALLKVAALKTMTLQPWATIAAMRTFR
ncbi:MAG: hypothetical protein WA324_11300 [Bryobacteraceae bacterium]